MKGKSLASDAEEGELFGLSAANCDSSETNNTCLLMTSEDRYFIYRYQFLPDAKLSFTRTALNKDGKSSKSIEYDLMVTQVCTIDRADRKSFCRDKRHFGINLLQKSSRKVYFTSFEKIIKFRDTALAQQGFSSAREQFSVEQTISEGPNSQRYLV